MVAVVLFIFAVFRRAFTRHACALILCALVLCARVQKCFPTRKAAADVLATQSRYLLLQRAKHVYTETGRVLQFKTVCDAGQGDTVAELVHQYANSLQCIPQSKKNAPTVLTGW